MKKKKINKKFLCKFNRTHLIVLFLVFFLCMIIFRLFYLNVFLKNHYKILYKNKTSDIVYGQSAPRGRIYDRNMKLLVDNKSVKTIYYTKTNDTTNKEELKMAENLSNILSLNYNKLNIADLKNYYMITNKEYVDKKITKEEYEALKNRKLTDKEIYNLKMKRITEEELSKLTENDKKIAYIYYLMNNGYYFDEKTIKEDISDEEYSYMIENAKELKGFKVSTSWERVYLYGSLLRGVLGSVSSSSSGIPLEQKDYYLNLGYNLDDRVGISGLEKEYESVLKGEKAIYKVNDNNELTLVSEGKRGNDIVLSIDIDIQKEIDEMLKEELLITKKEANTEFYDRSFIVIENPQTGEIISISGKQLLYDQKTNSYEFYNFDEGVILSTVVPGSVVKGASISVGYKTNVIDIGTVLEDRCIKLAYMPSKCSWRTLGYVNDLQALMYSSNVYQYKIAMMVGGFDYSYNKPLNIDLKAFNKYRNMFYQYGLGVSTGIDYPKEELGYKGGSSKGDLLINFAIGQYDTYTPLQLVQYISTLANNGKRMKINLLKKVLNNDGETIIEVSPTLLNKVNLDDKYISRIKNGLRLVMTGGTGVGQMGGSPSPAGKTGTSETFIDTDGDGIVDTETVSNNFIGFAPFDNPIMAIATSSPNVQNPKRGEFKSSVNYRITKKSSDIFFKYYDTNGQRKV